MESTWNDNANQKRPFVNMRQKTANGRYNNLWACRGPDEAKDRVEGWLLEKRKKI